MRKRQLIQQSRNILGGIPVFAGTRVPVRTMIDYLEEGRSINEFLSDFPTVTRKQATAILEKFKASLFSKRYESAA